MNKQKKRQVILVEHVWDWMEDDCSAFDVTSDPDEDGSNCVVIKGKYTESPGLVVIEPTQNTSEGEMIWRVV
jgi:hypothetical protein